ncbi:hypothetical protein B0T22DRAFT_485691 [Podospora appendiculata]|uniref:Yeast cell wall synthesis Kre9/Knh1-like N-terminal domain-containing protein n=1 Tax=Podospora appendiculata TaxID=314037 RepID=A0AAE0WZ93_9PEZI|nr:hypothetical protein B0T22DRAFT_485691 [Podospora appendiculata]
MRVSIIAASLFAACVSAIQVSSPTKNEVVDLSSPGFKVTWSTVSSDPTKAHLFLVNQAGGHTPYSKDLGEVDLKSGSVTVIEANVPADTGYQFNLQSVDPLNTGILAQSQQFEIKASDDKSSSSSAASTSTTSSATTSASGSVQTLDGTSGSTTAGSSSTASNSFTTTKSAANGSATGGSNATKTSSSAGSTSTAAAPTGKAASGSLLALAIGLVAIVM